MCRRGRYFKAAFWQSGTVAHFFDRLTDYFLKHGFGDLANLRVLGNSIGERACFAANDDLFLAARDLSRAAEFFKHGQASMEPIIERAAVLRFGS